jgi:peptidoglycan/xylan/chitin deacetylase (PgdA/CDA1 family)
MYHEISVHLAEQETVMPAVFAAQMEWLYGMGFRAISFDDLDDLDWEHAHQTLIITFDDGYASFMDYAFPLLVEYGFKATINIIGKSVRNVASSNDPILSWDECRYLLKSGLVDIGCHADELHVWGGWSTPSSYIATFNEKLGKDLSTFQERYQKELGRRATILAWPYGMYDRTSTEIATQEGFKYILTSNRGYLDKGGDRSNIPRRSINRDVDMASFRAYLETRP